VEDIQITYGGDNETTALESALRGAMSGMLPAEDLTTLMEWIRKGADKKSYSEGINDIIASNCLSCHDGSNPHLSNLDGFENIQKVVARDTGADLYTLVRVSHIHLFGLTFIFFIIGFIFSHAYLKPIWLKSLIIATPFAGVIADVLGWYLTKVFAPFAWIVLIAGILNGLSFATMWIVSMYQMWIYRIPEHLSNRHHSGVDSSDPD